MYVLLLAPKHLTQNWNYFQWQAQAVTNPDWKSVRFQIYVNKTPQESFYADLIVSAKQEILSSVILNEARH